MKTLRLRAMCGLWILCISVASSVAAAQLPQPAASRSWTSVRLAKWALLAAAVGFGAYAVTQSQHADDSYGELDLLCRAEQDRCASTGDSYPDARAERLYQRAVSADRRAHQAIIGGEVTLLGSAALFIYDLRNRRGPPDIPYPADSGESGAYGFVIGARVTF
ncbi:MAG: hypothetical protein H0W30_06270 [Gemmatimonadaceae bacterium]|nr:hypothetical protein [Gemmatimonadaceae bacterium]